MTSRFIAQADTVLRNFAHGQKVQMTGCNLAKGYIRFNGVLNGARVFQTLGSPRVDYQELLAYSVNLEVNRLGDRLSRWMTGYTAAMETLSIKQLEVARLMDSRLRVAWEHTLGTARRLRHFDTVFPTLNKTFAVPASLDGDLRAIHLTGAPGDQPELFAPLVDHSWQPDGYRNIWDATEDFVRERVWVGFIRFERRNGALVRPQPHRPVAWRRGEETAALGSLWAACLRDVGIQGG